ncbi:GNAT family N-acetyltransferase [Actinocorallia aurea]
MAEDLLTLYDTHLRGAGALGRGVSVERDGPLLRVVGQHRGFVSAVRDLSGHDVDGLIAAQKAYFEARGEAVEWKLRGHDLPADLPDRLAAAGFVPEPRETVAIGRVADLPTDAAPPSGVRLRRVDDEASVRAIVAMESEVWGQDCAFIGDHLRAGLADDPARIAVFVAETDGRVVAAAWLGLRDTPEFASLWGGSTLAPWRGRGIYRALVAVRTRLAADLGFRYLQVDASDESRPILEHLGFQAVTTTTPYVWSPAG